MKIYFRILRYAPHIISRLIKFFGFALLGVVFNVTYLALTQPMFDVLFNQTTIIKTAQPQFELSIDYAKSLFQYYFIDIVQQQGRLNALVFVCILIVFFVFLANLFRYLERLQAAKIKVDVVKNMRMRIFGNIMRLHIGFFNDQRKGDLMSRFTNDMAEVEGSVVNGLKSVFKEPITLMVFIGVLFSISLKLTLFTLIVLPLTGS